MAAYVDYEFYVGMYGGKTVPEDEFQSLEVRSRLVIDRMTFNRVKIASEDIPFFEVPEEIKLAQCAIMDCLVNFDINGGAIASETTSKHSVTYVKPKTVDEETRDIVKRYLGGTSWTYLGGGKGVVD